MNSLIVNAVITERCNLSCKYCYMDKLPNDMTMNTFNLFMNNIDKILSLYNKDKYQWE